MAQCRLMLDTNVVIDFINMRDKYYELARLLMVGGKVGEFDLWLCASQMTDIIYIASDGEKPSLLPSTLHKLRGVCSFIKIADVGFEEVDVMLNTSWANPEDALVHAVALKVKAQAIITRDVGFIKQSKLPAMDCKAFFKKLETEKGLTYDWVYE